MSDSALIGLLLCLAGLILCAFGLVLVVAAGRSGGESADHVETDFNPSDYGVRLRRLGLETEYNSCLQVLVHTGTCNIDECTIFDDEEICSCGKEDLRNECRTRMAQINKELNRLAVKN